tara:strand:- start:4051 stop:4335 length:285 start_codon:yes stop_codon:yes gene_type:complete
MKDKLKQGFDQATVSRGKRKGMLKTTCPPMNTYGSAVWQAIMMYSNPHKMGLGHCLFMTGDVKSLHDYVIACGKVVDLSTFDRDGNVLRELGLI